MSWPGPASFLNHDSRHATHGEFRVLPELCACVKAARSGGDDVGTTTPNMQCRAARRSIRSGRPSRATAERGRKSAERRSLRGFASLRFLASININLQMAGMLSACGRPCLVSSWARSLQKATSAGRWEQTSSRSFRTRTALLPCGWQSHAIRAVLPRWLGVLAPSRQAREQNPAENLKDFKPIYRFPGIRYCRALSRLKLLQTGLTALILPPVWFLCWHDQVTQTECLYSTGVACFAGVMLYAMSHYFRRIIGMMYLNGDSTVLRVAHLTFWGRRNDIYCPVETVMTLDDIGDNWNELLLRFKQYNRDGCLYFTLRFGQVVDKEGFAKVFGKV